MAVQIVTKEKKISDITKLDVTEVVLPEVVDDFAQSVIALGKKEKKRAPLKKAVTAQEKSIIDAVDEVLVPSAEITLTGTEYDVHLGPQGQRTEVVDILKAVEFLGEELFLKLAKISVTDLKKYLTPEQVAQVTETEYKTKRRVKVEAK